MWAGDGIVFVALSDAFCLPIEVVIAGSALEFSNDKPGGSFANDGKAHGIGREGRDLYYHRVRVRNVYEVVG
jgi:hypothetical protein